MHSACAGESVHNNKGPCGFGLPCLSSEVSLYLVVFLLFFTIFFYFSNFGNHCLWWLHCRSERLVSCSRAPQQCELLGGGWRSANSFTLSMHILPAEQGLKFTTLWRWFLISHTYAASKPIICESVHPRCVKVTIWSSWFCLSHYPCLCLYF